MSAAPATTVGPILRRAMLGLRQDSTEAFTWDRKVLSAVRTDLLVLRGRALVTGVQELVDFAHFLAATHHSPRAAAALLQVAEAAVSALRELGAASSMAIEHPPASVVTPRQAAGRVGLEPPQPAPKGPGRKRRVG